MPRRLSIALVAAAALVLSAFAPSALAAISDSQITSPTGPIYVFGQASGPLAFTATGTSNPPGSNVDLNCYDGASHVWSFRQNVVTSGGAFSRQISGDDVWNSSAFNPCVLRAVAVGDSTDYPPPSAGASFQGPVIAPSSGQQFTDGGTGQVSDLLYENSGLHGFFQFNSAQSGIATSFLYAPSTLAPSPTLIFEANAFNGGDLIKVDGDVGNIPASACCAIPGWQGITDVHSTLDPATGSLVLTAHEPVSIYDSGSNTYSPSGVELDRTWTSGADGRVAHLVDSWRSTDGHAHSIQIQYESEGATNSTGATLDFPGTAGFHDYATNDEITLPSGPGTIYLRRNPSTPAAGDAANPQGALTYAASPDGNVKIESATPTGTTWLLPYNRTLPAGGSATLRFEWAQDFALSDVQGLVAQAQAGFLPSVAIQAPADGSSTSTPNVTVTGTATDSAGTPSLTVNGQPVAVATDGSWSKPLTLAAGPNTITALATDADGLTSSRHISVTYTPPSSLPRLSSLGKLRARFDGVSITLSCTSAPCKGRATLTTTELIRSPGNKIVRLSKQRLKRRTVVIGRTSFSIASGARKAVKVKLNSKGRKLLGRFKRLPAKLTVRLDGQAKPALIKRTSIKAKPKKRRRHR
jgi:hypothetical protein